MLEVFYNAVLLQPRTQTRKELESVHKKASELLAQYYSGLKHRRKSEQKRDALLARLETDSELCACKALLYIFSCMNNP